MREVTFIRGLEVETVRAAPLDGVRYYEMGELPTILPTEELLMTEQVVKERVVPVHRLRGLRGPRSDTYIAYSADVQELLELPFTVMERQLKEQDVALLTLRSRLARLTDATLWERLRFLFQKRLPE